MKKKIFGIIKLAVFFALLAYFFIHLSYAVRPDLTNTRANISGYYSEPDNSLDVVIIGSSGSMSAFMPMEAWKAKGFTSYNFCTNEMAYEAMPYAVREAAKTQSPSVVLIDVKTLVRPYSIHEMVANGQTGDISFNTDGYKYSLDRLEFIYRYLPHTSFSFPYYFDILKYHELPFHTKYWNWEKHYLNRGYGFFGWGNEIEYAEDTDEIIPLEESVDRALDEVMAECKKGFPDSQVVFLYYPYAETIYNDHPVATVNYIEKRVQDAGFTFLDCADYFEEFGFDIQRDYWNNGHWNVLGSEKTTAWMIDYLSTHYDLPDHREDPAYDSWNKDIKRWDKRLKSEKKKIKRLIKNAQKEQNT
ncbi:MAG: hypothetical protein IJI10_04520 [Eubacterium sp.]|nr:hypothetical protein [Eubacterium sp.]